MNNVVTSSILLVCLVFFVSISFSNAYRTCGLTQCSGDYSDSYCCGEYLNTCCYYYDYDDYIWVLWVVLGVSCFVSILIAACAAVCIRNRRLRLAALHQQQMYANPNGYIATTPYHPYPNYQPPSNVGDLNPPTYTSAINSNIHNPNQKY